MGQIYSALRTAWAKESCLWISLHPCFPRKAILKTFKSQILFFLIIAKLFPSHPTFFFLPHQNRIIINPNSLERIVGRLKILIDSLYELEFDWVTTLMNSLHRLHAVKSKNELTQKNSLSNCQLKFLTHNWVLEKILA